MTRKKKKNDSNKSFDHLKKKSKSSKTDFKKIWDFFGGGYRILFRKKNDKDKGSSHIKTDTGLKNVITHFNGKFRLWLSVCQFKSSRSKRKVENTTCLKIVFVDLDIDPKNPQFKKILKDLEPILTQIINDIKEESGFVPYVQFSGQKGFHIILTVNVDLNDDNKDTIKQTWKNFLKYIQEKYIPKKYSKIIKVDTSIADLARVVGIPYTIHIDSNKEVEPLKGHEELMFRHENKEERYWKLIQDWSQKYVQKHPEVESYKSFDESRKTPLSALHAYTTLRKKAIAGEVDSRHATFLAIAIKLYEMGFSKKEIITDLYSINKKIPDPIPTERLKNRREFENIVKDTPSYTTPSLTIPPKPEDIAEIEHESEFFNILPPENAISKFFNYGTDLCDAYPEFIFLCAIVAISAIIKRKLIMKLRHKPKEPFCPNIFGILMGLTTKSRKTTAIDIMEAIIERLIYKYPDEMSCAGLIGELTKVGQGLFSFGEYSIFQAKMKREFNAGMEHLLCKLWDCPTKYTKKLRKERFVIDRAYPVLIGGVQPSSFAKYTTEEDLKTGYAARILYLYPTRWKPTKDVTDETEEDRRNKFDIQQTFSIYAKVFSSIGAPLRVKFTEESKALYNKFSKEFDDIIRGDIYEEFLSPIVGRLKEYALKLAMIFMAGDPEFFEVFCNLKKYIVRQEKKDEGEIIIPKDLIQSTIIDRNEKYHDRGTLTLPVEYLQYGIFYVTYLFLPHAKKATRKILEINQTNLVEQVREIIIKKPHITRSDLLTRIYYKLKNAKELDDVIEILTDGKIIRPYFTGDVGKKVKHYVAIKSKEESLG